MAKRGSTKKRLPPHASPLNASAVAADGADQAAAEPGDDRIRGEDGDSDDGHQAWRGNRTRAVPQEKLAEEAALADRLFGGGGGGGAAAAWMDEEDVLGAGAYDVSREQDVADAEAEEAEGGDAWGGEELFAIDRAGEEVTDDVEGGDDEDGDREGDHIHEPALEEDESGSEGDESVAVDGLPDEHAKSAMVGAAWQDSDAEDSDNDHSDDSIEGKTPGKKSKGVSLVDGPSRLKKLRRYRDETDPLSMKEYELRLRERFVNTASVAARTDWADVGLAQQQAEEDAPQKKKKRGYGSEDESSDEEYDDAAKALLQSNASLFATSASGRPLPPTLLNVVRTRDGNLADPNNSVVNACQFHPGSDEDAPLLMTAGMDKMLRFFRVDGEDNPKIHGIHFPKMPITSAAFLGDTGSVVLSGRRPFFYVYDALSGNIQRIPGIVGRKERSLEKFSVSPDGRIIAFVGNDGYVILVDGKTRQWMGDLKMNGSVRAITFSGDGEDVLGSGSDGDVYRWHIGSRRCVERFHNEDGTITSALAASSNVLAVGSETTLPLPARRGLSLASTERTPLKSIMNLTTSADNVCFNHDGQILAMATQRETNGLKLLHVPTATVFSNWPTSKTPLKYVWSMDFSPGSRYFAIGNDHGKCLLYKLRHYSDE
ncbi:hypothetical protein ACHAXT_009445 [Thalassiosira profunda]